MPKYIVKHGAVSGARTSSGEQCTLFEGDPVKEAQFAHLPGEWPRLLEVGAVEAVPEPEPAPVIVAPAESVVSGRPAPAGRSAATGGRR